MRGNNRCSCFGVDDIQMANLVLMVFHLNLHLAKDSRLFLMCREVGLLLQMKNEASSTTPLQPYTVFLLIVVGR